MSILENLKVAEKAWIKGREIAIKEVKDGASVFEITQKIENAIKGVEGAGIAFPLNISFNEEAAHYTPVNDSKRVVSKEDLIKIDIGTHSNGWIVDSAFTIDLSGKNKNLVDASKNAVNKAIKYIQKEGRDSLHSEIGTIIEKEITKKGFKPIYNLTGHSIDRYEIHAGESILNYKTNSKKTLGEGIFAIEPFATTGSGFIHSGDHCGIYFYTGKNTRNMNARKIINEIKDREGMPFSERWVGNDLNEFSKKMAISTMLNEKVLKPAPVLKDIDGSLVSQHEKTAYITKEDVKIFPDVDF